MKPLHALITKALAMFIAFIFSLLIRKGILSVENADTLNPLILEVIDYYLPIAVTSLAGVMHEIYEKLIAQRLYEVARQLPASSTQKEVAEEALGEGGKRTAAKIILGVK